MNKRTIAVLLAACCFTSGCHSPSKKTLADAGMEKRRLDRRGTEIMVCGQLFDIDTPVVLWTDPGGYDAYRTEYRWPNGSPTATQPSTRAASRPATRPANYSSRVGLLSGDEAKRVQGGNWPLDLLREKVDQFVIHYDVCGTSRQCFFVLHDDRNLSVHFMLDLDGTIYQTLDLKERAWHATISNTRSIGIEIANMGAYRNAESLAPLEQWYAKDEDGKTRITIPERLGDGGLRNPGTYRPDRNDLITGTINGVEYRQYDLTPQQYHALAKLSAGLSDIFPKIKLTVPRDDDGKVTDHFLDPDTFSNYTGLLGHWHVQKNKQDPGPAFQWDRVLSEAKGYKRGQ
jgi:N-acetylmuramoyl-L-alanine amidase